MEKGCKRKIARSGGVGDDVSFVVGFKRKENVWFVLISVL